MLNVNVAWYVVLITIFLLPKSIMYISIKISVNSNCNNVNVEEWRKTKKRAIAPIAANVPRQNEISKALKICSLNFTFFISSGRIM